MEGSEAPPSELHLGAGRACGEREIATGAKQGLCCFRGRLGLAGDSPPRPGLCCGLFRWPVLEQLTPGVQAEAC